LTSNIGHKTQNEDQQNEKHNTKNYKDEQHGCHQKKNRGELVAREG